MYVELDLKVEVVEVRDKDEEVLLPLEDDLPPPPPRLPPPPPPPLPPLHSVKVGAKIKKMEIMAKAAIAFLIIEVFFILSI